MPSQSLHDWLTVRKQALDEIEHAHVKVSGTGRGRRRATRQINYAYAVFLSSHFQGFCRDLHDECIRILVQWITPVGLRPGFRGTLELNRKLDWGNANPGNIGSDFKRFGIDLWDVIYQLDARNRSQNKQLQDLNELRNAIVHQDAKFLVGRRLHLRQVREWRRICENLAACFDEVMRSHIESITGASPW
jgi:hypothetical protein